MFELEIQTKSHKRRRALLFNLADSIHCRRPYLGKKSNMQKPDRGCAALCKFFSHEDYPSQKDCDELAADIALTQPGTSSIEQGSRSYSVLAGGNFIQFREPSARLDMRLIRAAETTYGGYVGHVLEEREIGCLWVYRSVRMRGVRLEAFQRQPAPELTSSPLFRMIPSFARSVTLAAPTQSGRQSLPILLTFFCVQILRLSLEEQAGRLAAAQRGTARRVHDHAGPDARPAAAAIPPRDTVDEGEPARAL